MLLMIERKHWIVVWALCVVCFVWWLVVLVGVVGRRLSSSPVAAAGVCESADYMPMMF
jgi:hypothetical protein